MECDQDETDIKDVFRTFQGAVEGGTSIYSGTQFDVTVSRMIGACVAGELSKAYIDILVFDNITYEPISIPLKTK